MASNYLKVAFLREPVSAVCGLLMAAACLPTTVLAAPQQPASDPSVSLGRIRKGLEESPAPRLKLDVPLQLPVATFKTRVEQRGFVLSLEEQLRKDFTLTLMQRQSQEWASKCCGFDLGLLTKRIDRALQRRELREIRQQIARELAELEAARQKQPPEER